MNGPRRPWPIHLAALALLTGGESAAILYLLARHPYDGLYGQDSYAYYYQALALGREWQGLPPAPGQLFTTDGLYHWPIGYHLHLLLGSLLGAGPLGGRLLTIGLTLLAPLLVYGLVQQLAGRLSLPLRVIGGVIAGAALFVTGTYLRMGLSLMADVPGLAWSLLAIWAALQAWPPTPDDATARTRRAVGWALLAGTALGVAVLIRYAALMLAVPLGLY